MSFDALSRNDDDAPFDGEDAAWTDEMAELASQLGRDAAHLASLYPAAEPKFIPEFSAASPIVKKSSFVNGMRGFLAIAAGLVGIVTLTYMSVDSQRRDEPHLSNARTSDVSAVEPVFISAPPRVLPASSSTPVLYMIDYSGPEREGMYDLLGTKGRDEISF